MRILFIFLTVLWGNQLLAQSTIADERKGREGATVSISGIVLNGDELGLIKYVQDTSAGIAAYGDKLANLKRGDSITVTGELDDFNNLLEITNISTPIIHSSSHQLPEPTILSISEIGEDYESQLVKINEIEFTNGGRTFAGDDNYAFTDGTKTGTVRISKHSPIVGKPIPAGKISITAICSQYSFDNNDTRNGYQLMPRDMDDFISGSSINYYHCSEGA